MRITYEYAVTTLIKYDTKPGILSSDAELDGYAQNGWELVTVITVPAEMGVRRIAYLRRAV